MNRGILIGCVVLLVLAGFASGCQVAAFVMPREHTYDVEAQYRGLDNQRVAVLVAADEYTLYRFPKAPAYTTKMVATSIQTNVPGARVADPRQILDFQARNPHWITYRYSDITKQLGVDRLVIIDLTEYRTHEPGNTHVWRGVMGASMAVVEADGADPDDIAVSFDIHVQYPEEGAVGLLDSDDQTMQLGMLQLFARDAVRIFHDHQVTM